MQTRRAKSPKRAQGFNLLLLLDSVGFTGGKLTSSFKYLLGTTSTNYITGVFGCRHVTFIL